MSDLFVHLTLITDNFKIV